MIILLIIKNEQIRLAAEEQLQASEHQVISATNSIDGISILKIRNIDLVITEVAIGDIDGWRLARFIRTGVLATSDDVPIVLVTENHCERIAETTAGMFDINRVISFQDISHLAEVAQQALKNINNLNILPKILVIEDTEDTANLVVRMLQQKFQLKVASDGIKGLEAFKQEKFDIVLLDIQLPGMSGEQVLEHLISLNPKQVVIAMTAHGTVDIAELMLMKGAADYIQKPFKAEQLRKVCDIAVKREDFIISNEQFSAKTVALLSEQQKYDSLAQTHFRILDSLNTIVIELNAAGRITFLNQAWHQCTGYLVNESIGRQFTDFIHFSSINLIAYVEESIQSLLTKVCDHQPNTSLEIKLVNKANDYFWSEVNFSPYYDQHGELCGIAGTIDNITIRKQAEENLKHLALHDKLTGLHNRYYFDEELAKIAKVSAKTGIEYALLYLDLDHFKVINDTQGHHKGDLVLKEIAKLLSDHINKNDVLCRIGGDEFAILLPKTNLLLAEKLAHELCNTIVDCCFQYEEQIYKVSCSIGISSINGEQHNSEIYLQQADIAMFAAKEKGRNRVHTFTHNDGVTKSLKQSFDWVQKIQSALVADQIVMDFQPVINLKTLHVAYYEALVRLVIEDKVIYPNDFIPSLEKAEDMNLLDRHVIGKTLSMMHQYAELNCVAINLSAQAFTDDRLLDFIKEKLEQYQIEPSRVIFELTESASLSNITGTQRMVVSLNELGCGFSIDDFGTGFSTFSYLKQIPAQSVKIDGSFVKDMDTDPTDAALVKAIHETAIALNKKTVAEFVENEEILNKLIELGIDYAQGYYIGKPMNIETLCRADNKISLKEGNKVF